MEGAGKPHSGPIFHTNWLAKLKFVKARKMSSSSIQIAYTTHYQKTKVVNSGKVGKLNLEVIIIVRLMV